MRDPRKVLVKPMLTEKSNLYKEIENVFTFKVARDASKEDIKRSVEVLFKVHVLSVRTANYMGKPKRRGRFEGHRPAWKKAVVQLAPGETIDIFEGL
ncbi:MAG TPA: 50S ribosomal protein L23 [candidate division Zixibacteria bacterium]|nr:50S ribosomal protein L23 [candidate division Zixibacteria bacterium]